MTQNSFLKSGKGLILKSLMFIFISSFSLNLFAQTDFSGVWIQDNAKSDDFYKKFNVKCTIAQNKQTIIVKTTFSDNSGVEMVTRESTFTLDGKETKDAGGAKKSLKWSADKKVLTTSDTKDYGGDIVGVTTEYSLSSDGSILTVKTSDIKPGVKTVIQIFNKKK